MHKLIVILENAGATGALVDVTAALTEGADPGGRAALLRDDGTITAALAESLGVRRNLACMVFTPDSEPAPLDVPVQPDEEEPETPTSPQSPQFPDSQAA